MTLQFVAWAVDHRGIIEQELIEVMDMAYRHKQITQVNPKWPSITQRQE
jgi:hypothetical protein